MRTLKKLEARIKMLECAVNRGHGYKEGKKVISGHSHWRGTGMIEITLKCGRCDYEVTKGMSELSVEEKVAAISLGLIPKEGKD